MGECTEKRLVKFEIQTREPVLKIYKRRIIVVPGGNVFLRRQDMLRK